MAVTKSSTTLQSGFTQANLSDQIKADLIALGFTFIEEYTATDKYLVFSYVYDAAKVYGTVYLRVRITAALAVNQSFGTSWTTGTKAIANESTASTQNTFSSSSPLELISYSKTSELRILQLSQGTSTTCFLGLVRPENKPSWWNEAIYPYGFILQSNSSPNYWNSLFSSSLNPYSNQTHSFQPGTSLVSANPITGKRDVLTGLSLFPNGQQGVSGRFSNDVGIAASNGLTKLDTLQVTSGSEEYTLLFGGNNGVVLRTI